MAVKELPTDDHHQEETAPKKIELDKSFHLSPNNFLPSVTANSSGAMAHANGANNVGKGVANVG